MAEESEIEKLKRQLAEANARAKAAEDTAAELAGFHNEEGKVACHLLCCYLAPNPGDRLIFTWPCRAGKSDLCGLADLFPPPLR